MMEIDHLNRILAYLREKRSASVNVLSKNFFISEATVRRDLNILETQGFIKRVHGGAVLLDGAAREIPLVLREQQDTDEKRNIAAQAAHHLQNGQTVFLDASSTVISLIDFLEGFEHMTIITNGLKTSQLLSAQKHRVYCTGGLLLHNSSAYVGAYAIDFTRRFNADIFFFSSRGLSDNGWITDASSEETQVRKAMLEQSRKHIFCYTKSKVGHTYCYNLCNISKIDAAITSE